jgi:hypothetical protein
LWRALKCGADCGPNIEKCAAKDTFVRGICEAVEYWEGILRGGFNRDRSDRGFDDEVFKLRPFWLVSVSWNWNGHDEKKGQRGAFCFETTSESCLACHGRGRRPVAFSLLKGVNRQAFWRAGVVGQTALRVM